MVNKIKQLFCKHQYKTITNFYYGNLNRLSNGKTMYKSEQECQLCGKRRYSPYHDKNCHIINYEIYYNKGIFREVKPIANNRTKYRGRKF